ncbi:MAG: MATE family efflux transporter [Thermodesulfobacteriota bacterium]|nr:MATE family efflux transporter [Thermodesulfobacteriota bacterium]
MIKKGLTTREIAFFFFPLVLNVQLMSISHTVINGALARLDDYITALAGMSVALVVHLFIASPSYQNHTITIAIVRGRKSLRGVLIFIGLVAAYVAIMLSLIAFTPLGDLILIKLLGTPAAVAAEAKKALYILAFLPFFTGIRGFCQGLIIRARKTSLVSLATGVRVAALFGFLSVGYKWFYGAQLGAFALVSCVVTETLVIAWLAWQTHVPFKAVEGEKTTGEILRYSFPLAYSSCLQQTIPLLISAIIGRLQDGALALAAFGVIRGFLFLLAGPMRNLQQAYLTLVKTVADNRTLLRFSFLLSVGLGFLVLLTAGPLNQFFLGQLLGVETDLRHYLQLPLAACAIFPFFYGLTNLLRGWFAGADQTGQLGRSTLLKSGFLLCLWWPLVTWQPPVSGIAVAIGLLLAAELLESLYLYYQRQQQPEIIRHAAPL